MASNLARLLSDSRRALFTMLGIQAVIWSVQLVNWLDDYRLSRDFGLRPQRLDELPEMFTMHLLHNSWGHIEANSWPLFVFGFLAAYRGMRRFLLASLVIAVSGGLTVWLLESPGTVTAGASGMVYGYFGYVVLRGVLDRNLLDAAIGVVVAAIYSYLLIGILPGSPGVSWLGHLGGLIGGLSAAWLLRGGAPKPAPVPAPSSSSPNAALLKELDDLGL
ncbi:rhomboid family intramembrane serine protease [Streptomyces kaniharaensis]|uniref:Rhomboid family intramembrane serine protease n=1 Tax=Streptomyces kaniharaensis TaxID=212423 RepID=A0A6N7KSM9_9ACTN|nr:rhomboid family intramembrane serine protease [Streptomyces kaniharaensis]MQS13337.1 rhomboid family intramembrane serine protease [Streptomyces kaniharaensis]